MKSEMKRWRGSKKVSSQMWCYLIYRIFGFGILYLKRKQSRLEWIHIFFSCYKHTTKVKESFPFLDNIIEPLRNGTTKNEVNFCRLRTKDNGRSYFHRCVSANGGGGGHPKSLVLSLVPPVSGPCLRGTPSQACSQVGRWGWGGVPPVRPVARGGTPRTGQGYPQTGQVVPPPRQGKGVTPPRIGYAAGSTRLAVTQEDFLVLFV